MLIKLDLNIDRIWNYKCCILEFIKRKGSFIVVVNKDFLCEVLEIFLSLFCKG